MSSIGFSAGHREGETPLPIPNREAKPFIADGTASERLWESRSLAGIIIQAPDLSQGWGLDFCQGISFITTALWSHDNAI